MTEQRKPREFWIRSEDLRPGYNYWEAQITDSEEHDIDFKNSIHVREVMPDEPARCDKYGRCEDALDSLDLASKMLEERNKWRVLCEEMAAFIKWRASLECAPTCGTACFCGKDAAENLKHKYEEAIKK